MNCNWVGTFRALGGWRTVGRWAVGLCCAAGIATGQQLVGEEPAGGLLQQYLAAKNRVTVEKPADLTEDQAQPASADDEMAAEESATSGVPLIQARQIFAPVANRAAATPGSNTQESNREVKLAPIVTPDQLRKTPSALPPRNTLPAAAVAPVVTAAKPFLATETPTAPLLRLDQGDASPVISVPFEESKPSTASREPASPIAERRTANPFAEQPPTPPTPLHSWNESGAVAPVVVQNPLISPRTQLAPITKPAELKPVAEPAEPAEVPSEEEERLAPIVPAKKLQRNPPPFKEASSPASDIPARPDSINPTSIREAKPIAALSKEASHKDEERAANTVQQASAIEQADATLLQSALQPLPEGEEFGTLPEGSPFEAIGESGTIKLRVRRSLLMRTKVDVYRTATVDEAIVELVQFTPREISLIGRSQGQTHITFWFDDANQPPVTYLVEVSPDAQAIAVQEEKYKLLENVINEMFPDSKVYLVLVADKLLVKGQARDSEEAAQIMTIIRAQAGNVRGGLGGGYGGGLTEGLATPVLSLAATGNNPGPGYTVINMLRVPGVQQVALKVKIAELNRSAARGFGVNVAGAVDIGNNGDELIFASILNAIGGGGTSVIASLDGGDLDIGIRYLQQRGVIRLLSEPTLVTLSGRPATFIAGGEFAVPTIVGNVGLNAVTTDFRAFGAIISFVPTVVDKDRVRLQVAPEFSQINNQLSVGGTPGLNVRAATTTVEMREGQTLAIAGLLEDNYTATTAGDLPFLAKLFGRRNTSRNETELIILVTPELVQPMEPEEVPPLPGFDVTEPTGGEFFLGGQIEGNPTRDHRSTVWPRLKRRYGMGGPAMTSGPFGHGQ